MHNTAVDSWNVFSPATTDHNHQQRMVHYMEKLRVADGHALGFLPLSVMLEAIVKDRVLIEIENGEPTGFLFWGKRKTHLRVYMIAIQQDNRRIYHARNLMLATFALEQNKNCETISLRCAEDLEANWFWKSVGFQHINTADGGMLRPELIRPRPGTEDYMIARALGKGILLKEKRRKNIHRQINIYYLKRAESDLWPLQNQIETIPCYTSVGG